jgi:predicted small lipoprotein YifL
MSCKLTAIVLVSLSAALAAGGCGGPPKQAEVPDADKESGVDIAPTEAAPGEGSATPPAGEDEMRSKCCTECKAALTKDRSGAAPDTIPCADYSSLSPWCREHFLAKPAMAASCQ